jgi:hypothetical protein
MESEIEEEYVSMRLAHSDITNVIHVLNRAKTENDSTMKSVLVRYCIIEYARPFTGSKGIFQKYYKPLKKDSIFPTGNADHEALIKERDERIAHSDIAAYKPRLHYWSKKDIFPIVQRSSHLYDNIDTLIDKMLVLCDIVLRYLVDRINTLEIDFRKNSA